MKKNNRKEVLNSRQDKSNKLAVYESVEQSYHKLREQFLESITYDQEDATFDELIVPFVEKHKTNHPEFCQKLLIIGTKICNEQVREKAILKLATLNHRASIQTFTPCHVQFESKKMNETEGTSKPERLNNAKKIAMVEKITNCKTKIHPLLDKSLVIKDKWESLKDTIKTCAIHGADRLTFKEVVKPFIKQHIKINREKSLELLNFCLTTCCLDVQIEAQELLNRYTFVYSEQSLQELTLKNENSKSQDSTESKKNQSAKSSKKSNNPSQIKLVTSKAQKPQKPIVDKEISEALKKAENERKIEKEQQDKRKEEAAKKLKEEAALIKKYREAAHLKAKQEEEEERKEAKLKEQTDAEEKKRKQIEQNEILRQEKKAANKIKKNKRKKAKQVKQSSEIQPSLKVDVDAEPIAAPLQTTESVPLLNPLVEPFIPKTPIFKTIEIPADSIPNFILEFANKIQAFSMRDVYLGGSSVANIYININRFQTNLQLMSTSPTKDLIVNNDLYLYQKNNKIWYATKTSQGIIRAEIKKEEYPENFDDLLTLLKKREPEEQKVTGDAKLALLEIASKNSHTPKIKPQIEYPDWDLRTDETVQDKLYQQIENWENVSKTKNIKGKHPIIRTRVRDGQHRRKVEIDIWKTEINEKPIESFINILNKTCDNTNSAMLLQLTSKGEYKIFGPVKVIDSFLAKVNDTLRDPKVVFPTDLRCLLRWVMKEEIYSQYGFKNSQRVDEVLNDKPLLEKWFAILKIDSLQRQRLSTFFRKNLFTRYPIVEAINLLNEHHQMFEAMTGLSYDYCKTNLHHMDDYNKAHPYAKQLAFYLFVLAHFCQSIAHLPYEQAKRELANWPFYGVLQVIRLVEQKIEEKTGKIIRKKDSELFTWIENNILIQKMKIEDCLHLIPNTHLPYHKRLVKNRPQLDQQNESQTEFINSIKNKVISNKQVKFIKVSSTRHKHPHFLFFNQASSVVPRPRTLVPGRSACTPNVNTT